MTLSKCPLFPLISALIDPRELGWSKIESCFFRLYSATRLSLASRTFKLLSPSICHSQKSRPSVSWFTSQIADFFTTSDSNWSFSSSGVKLIEFAEASLFDNRCCRLKAPCFSLSNSTGFRSNGRSSGFVTFPFGFFVLYSLEPKYCLKNRTIITFI